MNATHFDINTDETLQFVNYHRDHHGNHRYQLISGRLTDETRTHYIVDIDGETRQLDKNQWLPCLDSDHDGPPPRVSSLYN